VATDFGMKTLQKQGTLGIGAKAEVLAGVRAIGAYIFRVDGIVYASDH
jgi:hypothetical protein